MDKDGNSVSVTSSVNGIFGSYVFSESTGILLGNTMDGKSSMHQATRTETDMRSVKDFMLTILSLSIRFWDTREEQLLWTYPIRS